jgi:hypothetical protein
MCRDKRNVYRILVGKPGNKRLIGLLKSGKENNTKIYLKSVLCENVD